MRLEKAAHMAGAGTQPQRSEPAGKRESEVYEKLDDRGIDVLKEVCNVGAGHAATALSQLLGRRVNLDVPKVLLEDIGKVPEIAGGSGSLVVGLFFRILGDARGNIFMIFPEQSARAVVSLMVGTEGDVDFTGEMNVSAMKEVGNILASAFLSAISQLSGLNLIPSVPGFSYDMAGSIMDSVLIEISRLADKALVIETDLKESGTSIESHLFLLPDPHTLHMILKAMERTGEAG